MSRKKTKQPAVLTPEQARQRLRQQGISLRDFAKLHNIKPQAVYDVLTRPNARGYRGDYHRAAVALGIKQWPPAE